MGAESFLTLQIVDFAEGVDDRVAALLQAGTGITLTYNDGAGTLTIANTGLGGSTGSNDNRILRADGTGGATVQNSAVTIDDSGNISGLGTVECGTVTTSGNVILSDASGSFIGWSGASRIYCGTNGRIALYQGNLAGFSLLQFGGTSASFPALKRSGTTLQARLADDSDFGNLQCSEITASRLRNVGGGEGWGSIAGYAVGYAYNDSAPKLGLEANGVRIVGKLQVGSSQYWSPAFPTEQLNVIGNIALTGSNPQVRFGSVGQGYVEYSSGALNLGHTYATVLAIAGDRITCIQPFQLRAYTVGTLPSAAANAGALAQVTDSSVTTNGSAVSGGGSNRVVVFSNGSTWDVVVA